MSNDIAITSQPGATVGTAAAIFSPEGMDRPGAICHPDG